MNSNPNHNPWKTDSQDLNRFNYECKRKSNTSVLKLHSNQIELRSLISFPLSSLNCYLLLTVVGISLYPNYPVLVWIFFENLQRWLKIVKQGKASSEELHDHGRIYLISLTYKCTYKIEFVVTEISCLVWLAMVMYQVMSWKCVASTQPPFIFATGKHEESEDKKKSRKTFKWRRRKKYYKMHHDLWFVWTPFPFSSPSETKLIQLKFMKCERFFRSMVSS